MKISYRIIFFMVIAFSNTALAQRYKSPQLDSLITKSLFMQQDTNLLRQWDKILTESTTKPKKIIKDDENYTAAILYADKYLALAKRLKINHKINNAYVWFGDIAKKVNDITAADGWYKKAYFLSENKTSKANDERAIIELYVDAAMQFYHPGEYEKGRELLLMPQIFFESIKDITFQSYIYQYVAESYYYESNYDKFLFYAIKATQLFNDNDKGKGHVHALVFLANGYQFSNRLVNALECLQHAQILLSNGNDNEALADVYRHMASLYKSLEEYDKALKADKLAASTIILTKAISPETTFDYLNSEAYDYQQLKEYKIALKLYNQCLALRVGKNESRANILLAITEIYYHQKNYEKALATTMTAVKIYKEGVETGEITLRNGYDTVDMPSPLGMIYINAPDSIFNKIGISRADRYKKAEQIFNYNLRFAKFAKLLGRQEAAYENLSELYTLTGDHAKALGNYKLYILIRDSISKQQNQNQFVSRELQFSFNKREDSLRYRQLITDTKLHGQLLLNAKEHELEQAKYSQSQVSLLAEQNMRKANQQKLIASQNKSALDDKTVELQKTEILDKKKQTYYLLAGVAALLLLSFFITTNYLNQRKATRQISAEKQRSDDLLLNILPADVAEELKEKGSSDARLFDEVTVLFTDFVNFTTVSELLTPQELVNELNVCFKAFDGIMTTHQIEKIKTVGDAYLAVSGLPLANVSHAANVIRAAQEIQQFMLERKLEIGIKSFGIRIGVHSGSVVAGIVGVKKFAYDIWGDTVNTAARMEQNCEAGKINVSEKTYELVKDQFAFTYRGEIAAKNKGMMKMYFAENL